MYERVSQRLDARSETPVQVASELPNPNGFRVFEYGKLAFEELLKRISEAERSILIRAFLWRGDDAGQRFGEAILAAADRGVKVAIHKDRIAAVYEYGAGSCQSFFHDELWRHQSMQAWVLRTFSRNPNKPVHKLNPLAEAILDHPNIMVDHLRKRFDHSKLYLFDDRLLTLGSMGIGDNHLNEWVDVMVELDGAEHVERLKRRMSGEVGFDPDRDIDFLVHNRQTTKKRHCPMLDQRLALIEAARESLTIEMAYLGDRRFTTALLRAVKRGVEVTLVTAARADVLGNINRTTCNTLMRRTGYAKNLRIVLMPRMVHSKIVVVDHRISDIGSANFTALSHGVYDEINLYAVDSYLARALERVIVEIHGKEGEEADSRLGIDRPTRWLERAVVLYQSRNTGRLRTSQREMPRHKIVELKRADRAFARQKRLQRKEERDKERQERRTGKREERALVRAARRAGKADRRKARAERRQTRSAAKRALRADKRRQRAERKQRRVDGQGGGQLVERADRRKQRTAARREARRRKREERFARRQKRLKRGSNQLESGDPTPE